MQGSDEYMGVDLGGSHVGCVAVTAAGEVLRSHNIALPSRDVNTVLETISACCLAVGIHSCCGVGIAVPGNVDPVKGCTRYLPNFGWLEEVPLVALLSTRLNIPASKFRIRNDGRCAAIAESKLGAGRSSKVFAMLTLGTGIGGALIIDGRLFDGSSFDAGDFGHHVIRSGEDAMQCVCGKRGCFEFHASAQGLVRHYARKSGKTVTNAAEVLQLLRLKDAHAEAALRDYKRDLATGLANLVTFYNPDTIALGGGLSLAEEVFIGLREAVDEMTLPATRGKVKIVPAQLKTDAGAIGAALLALTI